MLLQPWSASERKSPCNWIFSSTSFKTTKKVKFYSSYWAQLTSGCGFSSCLSSTQHTKFPVFWPLIIPAYTKLPHIHWNSLLPKLRKTHGMSRAQADSLSMPHQSDRTVIFLLSPLPIKGCFDQTVKHEIPSEHPTPGKKPSLQWVICYFLGEKDKVNTELFTMAYNLSCLHLLRVT